MHSRLVADVEGAVVAGVGVTVVVVADVIVVAVVVVADVADVVHVVAFHDNED